jgi:hypothetical protein
VVSRRGREGCVVRLTTEADSVARTDMAACGGARAARGGASVVTLVRKSLVGTDGAALLLHRGAVALTVEVVRQTRLANILEVGRGYDELVMQFQCMKRWKMLTVPINGAGVAGVECSVTVLHSSRGDGSLGGLRGVEVSTGCVGIRCIHLVARLETKISELNLDLIGDSHDGNR